MHKRVYRKPFMYSTGAVTLAANATSTVSVQIANDADFEIVKLTSTATNANFTINIQDSVSGVYLFDRAQHALLILGSNTDPFILPVPYLVRANSSLSVTLADSSGAQNIIWVGFFGHKIHGQKTQTFE